MTAPTWYRAIEDGRLHQRFNVPFSCRESNRIESGLGLFDSCPHNLQPLLPRQSRPLHVVTLLAFLFLFCHTLCRRATIIESNLTKNQNVGDVHVPQPPATGITSGSSHVCRDGDKWRNSLGAGLQSIVTNRDSIFVPSDWTSNRGQNRHEQ